MRPTNMIKCCIISALIIVSADIYAQDAVTLTISGTGETKEKATVHALYNALGAVSGVYLSSYLKTVNDSISDNDIAQLSAGCIISYDEISCVELPDGQISILLSTTISTNALLSYFKKNKESITFDGQSFVMNKKLRKLKTENETIAVANMLKHLEIYAKDLFQIKLSMVEDPIKITDLESDPIYKDAFYIKFQLDYYAAPASALFYNTLFHTLKSISISKSEIQQYIDDNDMLYSFAIYTSKGVWKEVRGKGSVKDHIVPMFKGRFYLRSSDNIDKIINGLDKIMKKAQLDAYTLIAYGTSPIKETFNNLHSTGNRPMFYLRDEFYNNESFSFLSKLDKNKVMILCLDKMRDANKTYKPAENREKKGKKADKEKMLEKYREAAFYNNLHYAERQIKVAFTGEELMGITGFDMIK